MLRERIKTAKKVYIPTIPNLSLFILLISLFWLQIFTQSFVSSQTTKEKFWLQQNAQAADLEIDEPLLQEVGDTSDQQELTRQAKDALASEKARLKVLLELPLEGGSASLQSMETALGSLEGDLGDLPRKVRKPKPHKNPQKKKEATRGPQTQLGQWKKMRKSFFVFAK